MTKTNELNKIKKMYGENFMKLCRELFPTILEQEGKLYELLNSLFADNCKTLYDDIINNNLESSFKNYIYSKISSDNKERKIIEEEILKTPYELLEDSGYNLFECKTEEDIQKFKKYYAQNEQLCTFKGGRLNKCVVFFAVNKNAENIKREEFNSPKREDKYGTSVMGIQFNKKGLCTVSIKNRYNHTVDNPDATYGNDLNNITPGLRQSFKNLLKKRGLELDNSNVEEFNFPNYTIANDGKYYRYNMEINGVYYCPGNIIIENGEPRKLEKNNHILIDYFILDTKKKDKKQNFRQSNTIKLYDKNVKDSFIDDLQDLENAKVLIEKDKEQGNGIRVITIQKDDKKYPIIIRIDKNNQIIGYDNKNLTQIPDNFLYYNKRLNQLNLPNVIKIKDNFLHSNKGLTSLDLQNLIQVGNSFINDNTELTDIKLNNLKKVGNSFLSNNKKLTHLELQNLIEAGSFFLNSNEKLSHFEAPNLTKVGNFFLNNNEELEHIKLPNLFKTGNFFLHNNTNLRSVEFPSLVEAGNSFLYSNAELKYADFPNLREAGCDFLYNNTGLEYFNLSNIPELKEKFSDIIEKNTKSFSSHIDSRSIAKLDKDSTLTTSEINKAVWLIKKIHLLFRKYTKPDESTRM